MGTPENTAVRDRIKSRRWYWIRKIKMTIGCRDCGYDGNRCGGLGLDFAHRDPLDKHPKVIGQGKGGSGMNGLVKQIAGTGSRRNEKYLKKNRGYIKELFQEMRKCDVLCKICHVIETEKAKEASRCFETYHARKNF